MDSQQQTITSKSGSKGNLMIIAATIIWGAGMVAQRGGMNHVGPFTFNAARFFIGGTMALIPTLFFLLKGNAGSSGISKSTFKAGIICGTILCAAINLQQFGLLTTSVANASFITALYVIIVPIISLVMFKKKASAFVWIGVAIALVGMYFMSFAGGIELVVGDILVLLCAFGFAVQILVIGHFSPKHNVLALACVQFYTVSVVSLVLGVIFETPSFYGLISGAPYVLYTGVLSSGVAYILQMTAQKTTAPTIAAVLFSFESVVAAVTGWLVLNQYLTPRRLLGCALILIAILIAQLPAKEKQEAEP